MHTWCRIPCVRHLKLLCVHVTKQYLISYWTNNKDNQHTTGYMVWTCIPPSRTGSQFRLSMTKTITHALNFHFPHDVWRHDASMLQRANVSDTQHSDAYMQPNKISSCIGLTTTNNQTLDWVHSLNMHPTIRTGSLFWLSMTKTTNHAL